MLPDDHFLFWKVGEDVPQEYCKEYKRAGGFSGTNIHAQWRVKMMTKIFGPHGIGWGHIIEREWSETVGGSTMVFFVKLRLWYVYKETRYETGPEIGGTTVDAAPDELYKKSITDAMGKCMSLLGIGANIYLGENDASKYASWSELPVDFQEEAVKKGTPPKKPLPTANKPPDTAAAKASPPESPATATKPPPERKPEAASAAATQSPAAPNPTESAPATAAPKLGANGKTLCPKGHDRTKIQNAVDEKGKAIGKELICFHEDCRKSPIYPYAAPAAVPASGPIAKPPPPSDEPNF